MIKNVNSSARLEDSFIVSYVADEELDARIVRLALNVELFLFVPAENADFFYRSFQYVSQNPLSK